MFRITALARLFFFILLVSGGVSSTQLAGNAQLRQSQLEKRQARVYLNIFKGLFRSNNVVQYISNIPCDLIKTLESDVDEAKTFVEQLRNGETPSLIQQYPRQISEEVVEAFRDVIGIFEKLPDAVINVADAAVTDITKVFDDIASGAIVKDLERIQGIIVSEVTTAWGDLTAGLENGWEAATSFFGCLFVDCPHTTADAYTCNGLDAATTSAGAAPTDLTEIRPKSTTLRLDNLTKTAAPAQPPLITPFPTQTQPLTVNTRFSRPSASVTPAIIEAGSGGMQMIDRPRVLQLGWIVAVGVLGVALLL